MTKDYKHRVRGKNTLRGQDFDPVEGLSVWRWMLITFLAIAAVVLVVYVSGAGVKNVHQEIMQTLTNSQPTETNSKPIEPEPQKSVEEPEIKATQFDFYTILPEKETVVPDYEIKTRTREERVNQAKNAQYIIQAGSYNALKEAEAMRDKLGKMGIVAAIQKAKVGNTVWYRIKLGPFAQIASVNVINARLKQSGINSIVTETDK